MKRFFILFLVISTTILAQTTIDTSATIIASTDSVSMADMRSEQIELRTQQSTTIEDTEVLEKEVDELRDEDVFREVIKRPTPSLSIFGHTFLQTLFQKSTAEPTDMIDSSISSQQSSSFSPVNSGYRLGTGDELVISIWGDVQQNFATPVDRSGALTIPSIGQVVVAGLTLKETKEILIKKFTKIFSGVRNGRKNATTFIDVSMGRIRSKSVIIAGYVKNPGTHAIAATGGIIAAIAAAGGPLDNGSVRQVLVQHGGNKTDTVDIFPFLLTGKISDTVHVADYDVIIVPPVSKRVVITGAITQPAYYDLLPEETFEDLLTMAGGLLPEAYSGTIALTRTISGKLREAAAFSYRKDAQKPLHSNDSLFIPFVFQEKNEIVVKGSVKQPGRFGFYEGLTLYKILEMAGGVTEDFFPDRLEILRTEENLKKEVLSVNVAVLLASKGATGNIILKKRDVIKVYSVWDLTTREYVVIRGEVDKPGKYFLREGMTVQDIILLAGGITEYAYKDSIEVSRIIDENKQDGNSTESTKISVSVDFFKKSEFSLQHKDNVFVRINSSYKAQEIVVLKGELSYPGPYAKQHENETLCSLLKRAGGLKSTAYLEGAIFIRGKDSIGIVSIDLEKLLKTENKKDDIILENGDTLYIPTVPKTVVVKGSVNYPTAVKHVQGKNIRYYLKRAGGFNSTADKKGIYSILANGAVKSVRGSSKHVNAGTQIIVSEEPPKEENSAQKLAIASAVVAIFTSLSLVAVAIWK